MKANIIIDKKSGHVTKICRTHDEFKKELYIYQKYPDFIPELIDHDNNNTLIIEYIDGKSILELDSPDFFALASLFCRLHSMENHNGKCICLYDSNPNNFIYSFADNRYYMLDFSEWVYDYPEADLIHFLLFFASIYSHDRFGNIFDIFIKAYRLQMPLNPIEWEILVPEQILRFDSRRKKYNKIEKFENSSMTKNRDLIVNINWM